MDSEQFDEDRKDILEEMRKNNITTLTNTLSRENYEYTKKLFEGSFDVVKVCPGLYPQDAEKVSNEDFKRYLEEIRAEKDNILAIGEVGLDYKWTSDEKLFGVQVERFERLLELAIDIDKPIIIHTRKAEVEVLDILEKHLSVSNYKKAVLHCFSGKKKLIERIKKMKLSCSIPLAVLNTEIFQMLVSELPINQILAETDSPFLNPSKERNTPLNIKMVYEKIAEIKGLDKSEIENIIYRNYMRLFM